MVRRNLYDDADFAKFYDWVYDTYDADLSWYLELAREAGSPILEVACGTGRVTIPLARSGVQVVGLDLSKPMLDLARKKVSAEPQNVQDTLSFVQGDMEHFQLNRRFKAVFVPNASPFHLRSSEALASFVSCLYKHLEPGGILAIDLVSPLRMANQEAGKRYLVVEGVNPLTGLMTREYNQKIYIDVERQIACVQHTYVEQDGADEKQYEFTYEYRWIEKNEGAGLLNEAGFVDIETFGDYDRSPFGTESRRLMFTARAS